MTTACPALVRTVTAFVPMTTTVPLVKVASLATMAEGAVDWENDALAVMVEPFNPNDTLLLFENTMPVRLFDVVPALKFTVAAVGGTTDAVMIDPFSPKLTPLLLLNVTADKLLLVVPAETLMLVNDVAIDPVIVDPFSPNDTPLLLLNATALRLLEVVPAEIFIADRIPPVLNPVMFVPLR
jgi:hypothetical protein